MSAKPRASSPDQSLWTKALYENDDQLLHRLVDESSPGVSLIQLAGYVCGLHQMKRLAPWTYPDLETKEQVARITRLVDGIRGKLSAKEQREIDLALLRHVRRSGCVSVVLGAGASRNAGGPLWDELVAHFLRLALEEGKEIVEFVPAADNPVAAEPAGPGGLGVGRYVPKTVGVERFSPAAEREARDVLGRIESGNTKPEDLMKGAQICADLWGSQLFVNLTGILYRNAPGPGPIHDAVAGLAGPGRGWWRIVTYNYDDLMREALTARGIPCAAWGKRGDDVAGDPNEVARNTDRDRRLPVYHLHGYTPRRLFLVSADSFVLTTKQYEAIYGGPRAGILKRAFEECLVNPIYLALYVGCSFIDEEMNRLLGDAAKLVPGRRHFALLQWPAKNEDPLAASVADRFRYEKRYHAIGVQPIWFREFSEIPELIRSLE